MSLLTIHASVSGSNNVNTGTVTSAALTTTSASVVLYAFVISDSGTTPVHAVTGAGLTWTNRGSFVHSALSQGRLSVWTAIPTGTLSAQTVTATDSGTVPTADMALLVVAFNNADQTTYLGATAGIDSVTAVKTLTITTTRANSWVWGLYYDTTANTAPTFAAGNTLQFDSADANDAGRRTFVSKTAVTGIVGSAVTINTTAPANSTMLYIFEILPTMPSFARSNIRPHPFSPGLAR